MTSIYRPILKTAWKILWRAKYLWFFGFFAVIAGGTGQFNLAINNFSRLSSQMNFIDSIKNFYAQGRLTNWGSNFINLFGGFNGMSLVLLIVLLLIVAFIIWLAVVAQAGLVGGSYKEYRKQPMHFFEAFKVGKQNFWSVLGLNVVSKLVGLVVTLIFVVPLFFVYLNQSSSTIQFLLFLLIFIILIPLAIIISFLFTYALMYVVIKKDSFKQAIVNSWKLFIKNWVVSIEMAFIMFLVSVLAVILIFVVAFLLIIPMSFLIYVFNAMQVQGALFTSAILGLVVYIILLFVVIAALSTYQYTCWVLLFDKLNETQVFSKIMRLTAGLFGHGNKESDKNKKLETEDMEEI